MNSIYERRTDPFKTWPKSGRHALWRVMRSKLTIACTIGFFTAMAALCWLHFNKKLATNYERGIPITLIFPKSIQDIDMQISKLHNSYRKQEVSFDGYSFLFYDTGPYPGYSINGIYCFELLEEKGSKLEYWTLRGFFPINSINLSRLAANAPERVSYVCNSNSVTIQLFGVDLLSVKSCALLHKGVSPALTR